MKTENSRMLIIPLVSITLVIVLVSVIGNFVSRSTTITVETIACIDKVKNFKNKWYDVAIIHDKAITEGIEENYSESMKIMLQVKEQFIAITPPTCAITFVGHQNELWNDGIWPGFIAVDAYDHYMKAIKLDIEKLKARIEGRHKEGNNLSKAASVENELSNIAIRRLNDLFK